MMRVAAVLVARYSGWGAVARDTCKWVVDTLLKKTRINEGVNYFSIS